MSPRRNWDSRKRGGLFRHAASVPLPPNQRLHRMGESTTRKKLSTLPTLCLRPILSANMDEAAPFLRGVDDGFVNTRKNLLLFFLRAKFYFGFILLRFFTGFCN